MKAPLIAVISVGIAAAAPAVAISADDAERRDRQANRLRPAAVGPTLTSPIGPVTIDNDKRQHDDNDTSGS